MDSPSSRSLKSIPSRRFGYRGRGRWVPAGSRLLILGLVTVLTGLLAFTNARACFDIEPLTPAERGAATHLALDTNGFEPTRRHTVSFHGFRPFGLEQVGFGAVSFRLPLGLPVHTIGGSYQRLWMASYAEETHEVRCFFDVHELRCSPAIRLGTVRSDGNLLDYAVLADLSLEIRRPEGIRASIGLKNPLGLGMIRSDGPCPTLISIGLGYPVTSRIGWGAEIRKQAGHETCVSMGVEWTLPKHLRLRAGLRTYPEEFCLGIGLSVAGCVVDMAVSSNLDVGNTHGFGMAYSW